MRLVRPGAELTRNPSHLSFRSALLSPAQFHSENKQGEVGLRVWVDYLDAVRLLHSPPVRRRVAREADPRRSCPSFLLSQSKRPHTVLGFEGTATVSEPKGSWFDPALYVFFSSLFLPSLCPR